MSSTTYRMFRWGTHYVLGVDEIDSQHEHIGALLNELNHAHRDGASQKKLLKALDTLIDAVDENFATEERLMRRYQYPEARRHKASHKLLRRQMLEFRSKALARQTEFSTSVMSLLKDWLRDHMLGADKRLGDYIRPRIR